MLLAQLFIGLLVLLILTGMAWVIFCLALRLLLFINEGGLDGDGK